jgi:hypothetical protein
VQEYTSDILFLGTHVSVAIRLSNEDKHPSKGDTIKYIYTNSNHKNPLCRVTPIDSTYEYESGKLDYDKEKYKEMILDAAETVLVYFGFDRTVYGNNLNAVAGSCLLNQRVFSQSESTGAYLSGAKSLVRPKNPETIRYIRRQALDSTKPTSIAHLY